MPGTLQCFWGFLIWIKSGDLYDLPLSRYTSNSIRYKAFSYHYSEVDNKVQGWRTHQASRFTHKTYAYKWINNDKDGTYNSNHINMLLMKLSLMPTCDLALSVIIDVTIVPCSGQV